MKNNFRISHNVENHAIYDSLNYFYFNILSLFEQKQKFMKFLIFQKNDNIKC